MTRRVLNLLTLLSLLLFVAACTLWVRSYWGADTLSRSGPSHHVEVTSAGGGLEVRRFTYPEPVLRSDDERRLRYISELFGGAGRGTVGGRLGFGRGQFRRSDGAYTMTLYVVPWWAIALPAALSSAALGAAWLRRLVRRRRTLAGLCPSCGYDLRATPGRCPECGTPAPVQWAG